MRDRFEDDEDEDEYEHDYYSDIEASKNFNTRVTGFTQIPNFLLTDSTLSIQARLLYCNLLLFAWNDDFCYPTQKTLSDNMGISSRRIRDYLKELETKKCIIVHRHGYNNPNIYELKVFPDSKRFKKKYMDTFAHKKEKVVTKKRVKKKRVIKGKRRPVN